MKKAEKAPAFTLKDQDGKKRSLADYTGSWVVLYFYPKDDTPGCTIEVTEFTALKDEFEKEDAVILGCSPDTTSSHCDFQRKHKLGITLLSDPEHKIMERYGAWGRKILYGKTTVGVIRSTVLIGPDSKIVHHWKSVNAKGHAQNVLKRLKQIRKKEG